MPGLNFVLDLGIVGLFLHANSGQSGFQDGLDMGPVSVIIKIIT